MMLTITHIHASAFRGAAQLLRPRGAGPAC